MDNFSVRMLVVFFMAVGCKATEKTRLPGKPAPISQMEIPTLSKVNEEIAVHLKVEGNSGCWSELRAEMVGADATHLLFRGSGRYSNAENCSMVMVYKDTTIRFTPHHAGKYFFQANESPFEIILNVLEAK